MNEISDNELLALALEQNEDAKDMLYKRYSYIIDIVLKKYRKLAQSLSIDLNDMRAEALYALSLALANYQDNKNANLATFISLCVNRNVFNVIRNAKTKKRKILNEALSLDYFYDDLESTLAEFITDNRDPLSNLTNDEDYLELVKNIQKTLSKFEYIVFTFLVNGYGYTDIAKILNKTAKQIDNTIQRIKKKLRQFLKEVA